MASPSRRGSRLVPLRAALPCREGGQKEGWELFVRLFLPAWSVCASCSSLHAAVGVQCVASATGRQMCSRSSMPERLSPRPHHAHAPGENRKAWWGAGRQCMLGWRPQARAVAAAGGTAHSANSSKLGLLSPELRDEVVVGLLVLPVILPQLVVVCCAWALLVCGRRIEAGRARKFRQVGCVGRHAERAAIRAPIPPRADGRLARRSGPSGPGLPRAGRAERGSQASASNSSSSSSSSTGSGRGSAGAAAAAAAAASAAAALAEAEEEEAAMSGLCPAHGGTARGWLAGCWPADLGAAGDVVHFSSVGRTMARLALAALACAAALSSEISGQPGRAPRSLPGGGSGGRSCRAVLAADSGRRRKVAISPEVQLMGIAPLPAPRSPSSRAGPALTFRFPSQPRWPSSRPCAWIRATTPPPGSSTPESSPCPTAWPARAFRPPRTPSAT